jgi:hypothetical protein
VSLQNPTVVTLLEPDRIRVNFDEVNGAVVLIDLDDQEIGVLAIPETVWPAIAKVVARHLRARAATRSHCKS